MLNAVVHSGLRPWASPFGAVTYVGDRHDKHHPTMKVQNYVSVTQFLGYLLGTREP